MSSTSSSYSPSQTSSKTAEPLHPPASLHVIGFFPEHIATVVSLMAVALPFGGTLALTIMATVFNNTSGIGPDSPFRDFTTLSGLPEAIKSQIVDQAKVISPWGSFVC